MKRTNESDFLLRTALTQDEYDKRRSSCCNFLTTLKNEFSLPVYQGRNVPSLINAQDCYLYLKEAKDIKDQGTEPLLIKTEHFLKISENQLFTMYTDFVRNALLYVNKDQLNIATSSLFSHAQLFFNIDDIDYDPCALLLKYKHPEATEEQIIDCLNLLLNFNYQRARAILNNELPYIQSFNILNCILNHAYKKEASTQYVSHLQKKSFFMRIAEQNVPISMLFYFAYYWHFEDTLRLLTTFKPPLKLVYESSTNNLLAILYLKKVKTREDWQFLQQIAQYLKNNYQPQNF